VSPALDEFKAEFYQDCRFAAEATGEPFEDALFEVFTEFLVEDGELEDAVRRHYVSRGMRVDGFGGDPRVSGTLTLIALDTDQRPELSTLTATDLDTAFKRLTGFLQKSIDGSLTRALDDATPVFDLADLIETHWPRNGTPGAGKIAKVKLILVTDKVLSARVDGREATEVDGVPVAHSVWDIGRLQSLVNGRGREEMTIDLVEEFGEGIPALRAHSDSAGFETYLMVIPGEQLGRIYERWGPRLLEQNVRVFLQARGGVNKGIRNTIDNEPQMFLAYNNGITATAEEVELSQDFGKLVVTHLRNLQIVNGGQTTASISEGLRRKADLSAVFVQMKLSVVSPEEAIDVVPRISQYANSQNRVSAADFFSNHPFHVRFENLSRRVFAPSVDGTFRQSKWFYERARGQYQDARGGLSKSDRTKFELEYPKAQLLNKTDLAKYMLVWDQKPYIVSKGAQYAFQEFSRVVVAQWERDEAHFSEVYYKEAIAKAIFFRTTEKLVQKAPWYESGYRANIVAYTISKLGYDLSLKSRVLDFGSIWKEQGLTQDLQDSIESAAKHVMTTLTDSNRPIANVTEWAKTEALWERIKKLDVGWLASLTEHTLTVGEHREEVQDGRVDQLIVTGIEAQTRVVGAPPGFWQRALEFGVRKKVVTPKHVSILRICGDVPRKIPTDRQAEVALELLAKLYEEGFPEELP